MPKKGGKKWKLVLNPKNKIGLKWSTICEEVDEMGPPFIS